MMPLRHEVRTFAHAAEALMSPTRDISLNVDEIDMVRLYLKALDAMVAKETLNGVEI